MTDSPFFSKLETNFIPGDADVLSIKQFISQQNSQLSKLSSKVAKAKRRYLDLKQQLVNLKSSIESHQGLISPARRNIVPEDVWREIFHHCLPTRHDAIMHPQEPPYLLTQVCSNWRRIAFSTPRLWSSMHIPVEEKEHTHLLNEQVDYADWQARSERRARNITDWLDRSASCPLNITLGDCYDSQLADAHYDCTQGYLLLKTILPFSKQWGRLNIRMSNGRLKELSGLKPSDLTSLVSLELAGLENWGRSSNLLVPSTPRGLSLLLAPNLHQIEIPYAIEDISAYPLPWHQLTQLIIHYYPVSTTKVVNLLRACPKMLHFRVFASANSRHKEPEDRKPVSLRDLRKLEIHTDDNGHHSNIFDDLAMPALETVSLFIPSKDRNPLLSLAHHCIITSLNTNSLLFSESDFLLCLRSCKNLKNLYITDASPIPVTSNGDSLTPRSPIDGTDAFLEMLSVPDHNDEILCPLLEELQSATHKVQFTDQGILDFIKVKQAGTHPEVARLKCLKMYLPRPQSKPMAKTLQPYLDDGLDLVLQYRNKVRGRRIADAYRDVSSRNKEARMCQSAEPSTKTKLF